MAAASQATLKHIENLNKNDNYHPIWHYRDLTLNKQYKIAQAEVKKNQYGKRITLILKDPTCEDPELDTGLYFLPPSFLNRFQSLEALLKNPSSTVYLVLEQVKESDNNVVIPYYRFDHETAARR